MLIAAHQLGSTLDNREPTSSQAEPYDSIHPRWNPRSRLIGDHTLLVVSAIELISALSEWRLTVLHSRSVSQWSSMFLSGRQIDWSRACSSVVFLTLSSVSQDERIWEWAYAVPLSLDTIVPYDLVGEALTCHIVSYICLPTSAADSQRGIGLTVLSCIHGLPRLAFVHLPFSHVKCIQG